MPNPKSAPFYVTMHESDNVAIVAATRSDLARRWHDLMDVNAGTIADGTATVEQVGWELFRLMLDVASGRKKTWAEQWKLHNALVLFNPAPVT
jgi:galactarate dehydratase